MTFGRKAQLNPVGKIAPGNGGLKTFKAEGNNQQNCLQNRKCFVGGHKYFLSILDPELPISWLG